MERARDVMRDEILLTDYPHLLKCCFGLLRACRSAIGLRNAFGPTQPVLQCLPVSPRRVSNGDECMALLRRGDTEWPAFVMMDVNTFSTGGREALRQIKAGLQLKTTPVAVATTSASQRDVDLRYECAAKPVRYPQHLQLLTQVLEYWLVRVLKPTASKPSP